MKEAKILQSIFRKLTVALMCTMLPCLSTYSVSVAAPGDSHTKHNTGAARNPSDQTPPAHQQHHDSVAGLPGVDQTQFDAGLNVLNNPSFQHLITLLPALIASMSDHGDGSADPDLIEQARGDINSGSIPDAYRRVLNNMLNFFYKYDPEAGLLSRPNSQKLQDFLMPAVGRGCLNGGNAVGLALAAAGPQRAPAPGPREGETGYVFTAMGTGPAVFDSSHPLTIQWTNMDTHKSGKVPLAPNRLINSRRGPATFTVIVPTGHGRIMSTITGTLTAKVSSTSNDTFACKIAPTVGLIRN